MTAGTRGRAEDGPREPVFYSALHDLERIITTHLFVICPTDSGSTFLRNALATSRRTWNLLSEGRSVFGVVRPMYRKDNRLTSSRRLWAARKRWLDVLRDPAYCD